MVFFARNTFPSYCALCCFLFRVRAIKFFFYIRPPIKNGWECGGWAAIKKRVERKHCCVYIVSSYVRAHAAFPPPLSSPLKINSAACPNRLLLQWQLKLCRMNDLFYCERGAGNNMHGTRKVFFKKNHWKQCNSSRKWQSASILPPADFRSMISLRGGIQSA